MMGIKKSCEINHLARRWRMKGRNFSRILNRKEQSEIVHSFTVRLHGHIVLLALMFLWIPVRLAGQDYDRLEQLVDGAEEVKMLSASDNGQWLGYYIDQGDGKRRKMMVQNTADPNKIIERSGISMWRFVKNRVAVKAGDQMEYLDPETGKSTMFEHVKSFDYDQHHDVLLVSSTQGKYQRLGLYDPDGHLLQGLDDVVSYSFNSSKLIVRRKAGETNEVWVMKKRELIRLYSTQDEIRNVLPSGMQKGGYVINTRRAGESFRTYISEDLQEYGFNGNPYNDYEEMSVVPSQADDRFILKLTHVVPNEKGLVEIWYGTDFNLAKHVRPTRETVQIEWNPLTGEQRLLTHPDYFGETAIGNNLYLKYAVDKEQVDVMDKAAGKGSDKLYLWNALPDVHIFVADVQKQVVIAPDGQYLLIEQQAGWKLFNTGSMIAGDLAVSSSATPYFSSSHVVLWTDGARLFQMDLRNRKITDIYRAKDGNIELLNYERISTELKYPRDFRSIDVKHGLLLKISNPLDKTQSFAWFKNKKRIVIVPPTNDHITEFAKMNVRDVFYWIQENFNQLPKVKVKRRSENSKTMYVSNLVVEEITNAEVKKLFYTGAGGEQVTGTLFMPLKYDPSKKYPVVVHIYEKQDYLTNRFLRPSFANGTGLNIALLNASGFAVFLPDISYSDKGPGMSALESVNHALDELQRIENVDMRKIGLMGQSFGGYETNFIATQSNRFAAYISGASVSDVIRTYYAFNDNFNAPDYYRYEGGQNNYQYTLAENPQKYILNNPIMYAQNINAPMLLWAGKDDGNVSPEGIRSLYIALRKYRKPVVALFYEKERHSLSSLSAQKDLSLRVIDWFNYFLKGQKDIPWIGRQVKGRD